MKKDMVRTSPPPMPVDNPFADPSRPNQESSKRGEETAAAALTRAVRITESTNDTAQEALTMLNRQRETISHSISEVHNTHSNLVEAKRVIRAIRFGIVKERIIKTLVILALVLVIFLIVYVRWIRRK